MMDVDWLGNEIVGLPHARQSLSLNMFVVVVVVVVVALASVLLLLQLCAVFVVGIPTAVVFVTALLFLI